MRRLTASFSATALLMLAACGSDDGAFAAPDDDAGADTGGSADAESDAGTAVTYHEHVRPLVETACAGCHVEGGIGPFALTDPAVAIELGPGLIDPVLDQRMPPWLPDETCRPVEHSRALSDAERDVFRAWREGGYVAGDPADYVAPEVSTFDPGPPDLVLEAAEPWTPDVSRPDDYRCLLLEHEFDDDVFFTGYDVFPGQTDTVHHVLLYLVRAEDRGALAQLDARDDGPGFACFGGVGVGAEQVLAAWAPGGQPVAFPEGSAMRIPAGAALVMQVHYNTLAIPAGETAQPDATTAGLWLLGDDEQPTHLVQYIEFLDYTFRIPADEPEYTSFRDLGVPVSGDIIGVLPHMHTLGERIEMRVGPADEPDANCLIDIPDWDFNWQQVYLFGEGARVPVEAGDVVSLACTWDNSAANQPVVNGERVEPRDVRWGDGTLDEMCYSPLLIRTPYWPGEGVCGGFLDCAAACDPTDPLCFTSCALQQSQDCFVCMLEEASDCAIDQCVEQAVAWDTCDSRCADEWGCFVRDCAPQFGALLSCLVPALQGDACAGATEACGVGW